MSLILYSFMLIVVIIGASYLLNKLQLGRFGYWLLAGYTVVLLLSVVLYLFIPKDGFVAESLVKSDVTTDDMYLDMIGQVVYEEVPIEAFDPYKKETWEFEIGEQSSFSLLGVGGRDYYYSVIVERVEEQDTINITLYESEPNFNVEEIQEERLSMKRVEDEIIIQQPGNVYIEMAQLMKEFPFTQFSEGENMEMHGLDFFGGERVLYMTIPEHVEITADHDIYLEWLNEEKE